MSGEPGTRSHPRRLPRFLTAALCSVAVVGATTASITIAPATAAAQSVTVNFNSLVDTVGAGVRFVQNCYTESGYTFTAVGIGCGVKDAFITAGPANPLIWTGSPALTLNSKDAKFVDFMQSGGGTFSLQSIGLAPYFATGASVMFTGYLAGGSTVQQSFMVPAGTFGAVNMPMTYTFSSAFTGLSYVRMAAMDDYNEPYVAFDNVTFTSASTNVVPEPSTVALFAGGLLGLGALARTRGSRRRATSASA